MPKYKVTRCQEPSGPMTEVYAFGSNGAGQLGVGHGDDLSEPRICLFNPLSMELPAGVDEQGGMSECVVEVYDHVPCGATVKKVVAGGNHTLLLTDSGVVYASGNGDDGRCGFGDHIGSVDVFTLLTWTKDKYITDVAATWEASFFVEDGKRVWACGSGEKGELGLGEGMVRLTTPRVIFEAHESDDSQCRIIGISGSMSHIVILLSAGQAYGWGSCRKGQLGQDLSPRKSLWKPHRINLSFAPSAVVVGRDFSLFTDSRHNYATLGDFKPGPRTFEIRPDTLSLHYLAGWSTIYQLDRGCITSYGQGRRGQLHPFNLPLVSAMAAGSEHCVAILHDNRLVAWGWGEHGNCGTPLDDRGNVFDRFNTLNISSSDNTKLTDVGAGCASSFVWRLTTTQSTSS